MKQQSPRGDAWEPVNSTIDSYKSIVSLDQKSVNMSWSQAQALKLKRADKTVDYFKRILWIRFWFHAAMAVLLIAVIISTAFAVKMVTK